MLPEFVRLEGMLRDLCGKGPVFYLSNSGNWGDGLIREATLRFLERMQLRVVELPVYLRTMHDRIRWASAISRRGTLLVQGSGAWSSVSSHLAGRVNKVSRWFRRVVVLPSSFEIRPARNNIICFSRDRFESMQTVPDATFCHDLAFSLGPIDPVAPGEGEAWFMRGDAERHPLAPVHPDSVDLSVLGRNLWRADVAGLFQRLAQYAVIHTDRLHLAIGAMLLGRIVHLYPSRLFKIRAIYRSSIEPYFDNVTFHDLPS